MSICPWLLGLLKSVLARAVRVVGVVARGSAVLVVGVGACYCGLPRKLDETIPGEFGGRVHTIRLR